MLTFVLLLALSALAFDTTTARPSASASAASPPPPRPTKRAPNRNATLVHEYEEGDLTLHAGSLEALGILGILIGIFLLSYLIEKHRIEWLSESQVATALGALIGGIIALSSDELLDELAWVDRSWQLVFLVCLPIVIFDGAYNMRRSKFFANLFPIMMLAILGTIASTFFIGFGLYALAEVHMIGPRLSLLECMLFGSLISATDPVAVLSIFRSKHIDADLHAVIFGESLLNDSAALVMYETLLRFLRRDVDAQNIVVAVGDFFIIFLGSTAIGVGLALLFTLFFKHVDVKRAPMLEVSLFVCASFLPYFVAQGMGFSGIVSVLFAGIVMSHYTYFNISKANRLLTKQLYHLLRMMAETFLFLYLGIEVFIYEQEFSMSLVIAAVLIVLVSRAVHVYPLMSVVNCTREPRAKFDSRKQFVIWLSGLRGAVAFALAVLADKQRPVIKNAGPIVTATLIVCVLTMFGCGIGVYFSLDYLDLVVADGDEDDDDAHLHSVSRALNASAHAGDGGSAAEAATAGGVAFFVYLDRRYFKPFLTTRARVTTIAQLDEFVDRPPQTLD